MKEVRVRFAPSPTGFLHVGGARTAIFNWLFAKNQNGKFLLRIEDTDPERSKSELSAQIIRSMNWLQMFADEPVIYQSDNIARYKEVVKQLLNSGKAYYAFESPEELDAKRREAQVKKIPFKYDRASLKLSKETIKENLGSGKNYTVRFLVSEGETEFDDIVHGKTVFQNSEIDDFVILRSDGSPVYQLAVVVDDNDMAITHIIRGDDHLSNTPKQILLYKALGWQVPCFAHLPMILDEQKKKLSKRRNTVSVEEYKEQGYLPEALFNFLTLLGFAPPSPLPAPRLRQAGHPLSQKERGETPSKGREIISRESLVKEFTFERVNKSSAVFDTKKLKWINSEYIKMADENRIAEMVKEKLIEKKIIEERLARELPLQYIISVVRLMKERVSTINDFIEFGKYFFAEPVGYDEKSIAKYWNDDVKKYLGEYLEVLKNPPAAPPPFGKGGNNDAFTAAKLEQALREFTDSKGTKASQLIHPLRLALTGISISPGIFELMEVLGKDRIIARITNILKMS
jgi:glutamyl-tRNA synthetase